jgi:hypothetical protein
MVIAGGCARRQAPAPSAVRARTAESGVIPAGTNLSIKSVVRIDGKDAGPADGFPAVIVGTVHGPSGEALFHSGSPVRLVILKTTPPQLGMAAVMVGGSWRAVEGAAGGAPLGALIRGVLDPDPRPQQPDGSMAIRTAGPEVQVPAGALLIFRTAEPLRLSGTTIAESPGAREASI